ncbi:hypothetical protein GBAR_LOCUS13032, partial [Geodia barretti]
RFLKGWRWQDWFAGQRRRWLDSLGRNVAALRPRGGRLDGWFCWQQRLCRCRRLWRLRSRWSWGFSRSCRRSVGGGWGRCNPSDRCLGERCWCRSGCRRRTTGRSSSRRR